MAVPGSARQALPSRRPWLLLLAASMLLAGGAGAGNMQRPGSPMPIEARSPGSLDGQTFTGEFGPIGEPAKGADTWAFKDGSFRSESCVECGFPQSVYSTASSTGGTDFHSTTGCPVSDAIIVWEGTVKDGKIEGVYTWTKKRWYRTVRKKFWFKGTIEDSNVSKLE